MTLTDPSDRLPHVVRLGLITLRAVALLNGIASLALLAFIAVLTTADSSDLTIDPFVPSLYAFCLGAFCAVAGIGTLYLSELSKARDKKWSRVFGRILFIATLVMAVAAYGAFFRGAHAAMVGFWGEASVT